MQVAIQEIFHHWVLKHHEYQNLHNYAWHTATYYETFHIESIVAICTTCTKHEFSITHIATTPIQNITNQIIPVQTWNREELIRDSKQKVPIASYLDF